MHHRGSLIFADLIESSVSRVYSGEGKRVVTISNNVSNSDVDFLYYTVIPRTSNLRDFPGSIVSPIHEANSNKPGSFLCWQPIRIEKSSAFEVIGQLSSSRSALIKNRTISCLSSTLSLDIFKCFRKIRPRYFRWKRGSLITFRFHDGQSVVSFLGIVLSNTFGNCRSAQIVFAPLIEYNESLPFPDDRSIIGPSFGDALPAHYLFVEEFFQSADPVSRNFKPFIFNGKPAYLSENRMTALIDRVSSYIS